MEHPDAPNSLDNVVGDLQDLLRYVNSLSSHNTQSDQ